MSIIGSLETFSLPELFRLIDSGSKTAELIIQPPQEYRPFKAINDYPVGTYHLWFYRGQLVTLTSNRLDHLDLITLIEKHRWTNRGDLNQLADTCPANLPLGVYLDKKKILKKERLKSLFQLQLHQAYKLFNLSSGKFQLKVISEQSLQPTSSTMPWLEMTGHSIQAVKVNILALRMLKNWDIFTEKLPEPSSALQQLVYQPILRLTPLEQQIWQIAFGTMSLEELTQIHNVSLLKVQKAAFGLMMARLVEEIPLAHFKSNKNSHSNSQLSLPSTAIAVNSNSKNNGSQLTMTQPYRLAPPKATRSTITNTTSSLSTHQTSIVTFSDSKLQNGKPNTIPTAATKVPLTAKPKVNSSLLRRLINFLRSKL
ncbi:MAG: DUF4388 domain-containing protein [Waterburya sp.]